MVDHSSPNNALVCPDIFVIFSSQLMMSQLGAVIFAVFLLRHDLHFLHIALLNLNCFYLSEPRDHSVFPIKYSDLPQILAMPQNSCDLEVCPPLSASC